jgi:hypothetical protein
VVTADRVEVDLRADFVADFVAGFFADDCFAADFPAAFFAPLDFLALDVVLRGGMRTPALRDVRGGRLACGARVSFQP